MGNLLDINNWRKELGLFPIYLNPTIKDDRYLMLNGTSGDFCLQTKGNEIDEDLFFEYSWSTNTKNFLSLSDDFLYVYNWYNKNIEKIPRHNVRDNLNRFHSYLISKSFKSGNDVIPFILDIFKQLRNVTKEREKPVEALNLLFQLLISIEEDYNSIDNQKWGITETKLPKHFEGFVETIRKGVMSITPNLDLILRHTSGTLFQEAHREVIYFNPQMDLFGGVSSKLITKSDAYSSIHYTPQYLARTIVENCIKIQDTDKKFLKIFDPSCGSCEFIIEALKQLKNINYKGKIKIVGWDSSESAVSTSRFLLHYENRTQWDGKLDFEIKLVNDSLTEKWDADNDLILMNPPFLSWELLNNKDSKDAVLQALGSSFKKGRPNQASAFFYKATQAINKNGIIGCVLPSSIFNNDAYKPIRKEIQDLITITLIAKLGNFVFEDALTDVSFLIGRKPKTEFTTKLIWSRNEKGNAQEALREFRKLNALDYQSMDTPNYSIFTPSKFPIIKDSWKVLSMKDNILIKDLERYILDKKLFPITEIFKINQGALLGIKNIFKISLNAFENLPKGEQKYFRPVITNKSISNGKLDISEYVWYPYNLKGLKITSENELRNISFAEEILIPNEDLLKKRKGIANWWGLTRPRNWQFSKEMRLYSSRFGNSNSFAFDSTGNCVIEEGNAFIPKREFNQEDYYFYLACFSSTFFDKLLAIYSKQLAGGYWYDLGSKYLRNIPVPNVHQIEVRNSSAYLKLIELGKELEDGNSFVKQVIDEILTTYFYPRI